MPSAPDFDHQARELIRIVGSDTGLKQRIRRAAHRLDRVRATNPGAALGQLDRLYRAAVAYLPTHAPTVEYSRLVGLDTFYHYNLKPAMKEVFPTPAGYIDYVSTAINPSDVLMADIGTQDAVDAEHSWMVPYASLNSLNGIQARKALRFHQSPPYAVMIFSTVKMLANNVLVRDPRGVDAIPGRILDWYPGNVPAEKINSDIPRAALDRVEWLR